MGYSSSQYRQEVRERKWKINPVWRGIGCFMLILIPIMSWYGAAIILNSGMKIVNSRQMTQPMKINYIKIAEIDRVIASFNTYTASHHLVAGQFVYTVLLMFVGFGILSVVYAVMYGVLGPPRYGPFDVPPSSMRR